MSKQKRTVRVFYSYAHQDRALRDRLEMHLDILRRQGQITDWSDRDIRAGRERQGEIDVNLNLADVILLLISPDFMHSDYCYGIEMEKALERHKKGEARVIPIILRPVDWQVAPFSELSVLPSNGRAITEWSNHDKAFLDVETGIKKAVKEILDRRITKDLLNKAKSCVETNQYEQAVIAYEQVNQLDPDDAMAYCLRVVK